ncbi:MAG TPA: hypothetical protein VMU67_11195 [Steroidobacteraceae bacterium]|nr:hypothetical protein [Steroidobacteraceae bacterium]
MRHLSSSRAVLPLGLVLAVGAGLTAAVPSPALAASDSDATQTVSAQWVRKKIFFVYQGFTAHYSCEGLTSDVRHVLAELGARRSDLNVRELACTTALGVPNAFPGVEGTFSVLEPLSASGAPSSGAEPVPVSAHWVKVRLKLGTFLNYGGDCELIDQIKQKIIPLVTTRNVRFSEECFPHQLAPPGSQLEAEVLLPVSAEPADRAAH